MFSSLCYDGRNNHAKNYRFSVLALAVKFQSVVVHPVESREAEVAKQKQTRRPNGLSPSCSTHDSQSRATRKRVLAGELSLNSAAAEFKLSRQSAVKWARRDREGGSAVLRDLSSHPHRSPRRISAEQAQRDGFVLQMEPEALRDAIRSAQWSPHYPSYL